MVRHRYRRKPDPGTARWFRRYRKYVLAAWAVVLVLCLLVFWWPEAKVLEGGERRAVSEKALPAVAAPVAAKVAEPLAVAAPARKEASQGLDAPHGSVAESWGFMGHLQADSGERYSFYVSALQRKSAAGEVVFLASLLDHETGKHVTDQLRVVAKGPAAGAGFALEADGWLMRGAAGQYSLKLAGKDFSLDLSCADKRQPAQGRLEAKSLGTADYAVRSRMAVTGSAGVAGVARAVRGEAWLEHVWSDFDPAAARWHSFALQLASGADVWIYELLDQKGVPLLRRGFYAQGDTAGVLSAADFKATAQASWRSPSSAVVYPMEWTISLPAKGVEARLEPVIRHSQFNARATTGAVFWKGAVKLPDGGVGFMALGGYRPEEKKKK